MSAATDEEYGSRWAGTENQDGYPQYRRYGQGYTNSGAAEAASGRVEPDWARGDDRDAGWRRAAEPAESRGRAEGPGEQSAYRNPYDLAQADQSARALLADARERIDRAIAAAAADSARVEAERARLEQRAGESERMRLEAVRQQDALEMVLRRTEERLIASERDSAQKDEHIAELHRRLAGAEARAAEAEREREDEAAAASLRIEDIEAQADARVEAARSEAAQAIEDARAEAAAEIERAKEEFAPELRALEDKLAASEHRAEAAEVAAEAAEQAAEAAAGNAAFLREEADRLRKRVEDRVKELEKELADSQTEILQLKDWRAKTIERLRSAGLLRSHANTAA